MSPGLWLAAWWSQVEISNGIDAVWVLDLEVWISRSDLSILQLAVPDKAVLTTPTINVPYVTQSTEIQRGYKDVLRKSLSGQVSQNDALVA
jgi:hypothetical protein